MSASTEYLVNSEARADSDYHQLRVLLLVAAVSGTAGHAGKVDGLTKLAKLDFLVRYPGLMPIVLDEVAPEDTRLALSESDLESPTEVEAPMIRYRYGPWDNRYYPVVGALVARGLLRFAKSRRGSMALAPTPEGKRLATQAGSAPAWQSIAKRCDAAASGSVGLSGNALKQRIYDRLPELMNRPHREVIA